MLHCGGEGLFPHQIPLENLIVFLCPCSTLYDVFHNIADDEREHVKTMKACRDYSIVSDIAQRKLTGNGSNNMTPDFSESNGSGKALGKPTQKTGIKQMDTSEMS